jgi:hypothetical protein
LTVQWKGQLMQADKKVWWTANSCEMPLLMTVLMLFLHGVKLRILI